MGIGLLIMLHPEFAKSWICKLASLYYWALAVLIPWLVVRKEKKHTSRHCPPEMLWLPDFASGQSR
jgi:hypothetical protein